MAVALTPLDVVSSPFTYSITTGFLCIHIALPRPATCLMSHACVSPFDKPSLNHFKRNKTASQLRNRDSEEMCQKKNGVPITTLLFALSPRLLYPRTDLIGMCFGKGGRVRGATFPTTTTWTWTWTETSRVGLYLGNGGDDNPAPVLASRFPHAPSPTYCQES